MRITEPSITTEMKPFFEIRGIHVFPPEVSPQGIDELMFFLELMVSICSRM